MRGFTISLPRCVRGYQLLVALTTLQCLVAVGSAQGQEVTPSVSPANTWTIPSDNEIRSLLAERMQHNGVGIVVGIIEPSGRRVIAYGKRSAGDRRPLDGDTVFQIGSVTKVFTGLLLADMIRRGEVQLDDPAVKYLPPEANMPARGRQMTLFDLATHRSGLPAMPTNFDLRAAPNPYEAYTVKQLHQFLAEYEFPYEPGVRAQYSNVGMALLGRLLANRVGTDYESLLKERVLDPLGMHDTVIALSVNQRRRLAPGHDRYLQPVGTWEMRVMPASGSLRSTANDMLKFLAAHLGYTDGPLSSAMEYQRATRQPPNGSAALGLSVRRSRGEEQFGHDGGKEGYRSGLGFNPRSRTGIVVLANARTDDLPINIALHIMTGRPLPPAPHAPAELRKVRVKRSTLDAVSGTYRLESNQVVAIARKGDRLLIDTRGDGIESFFPSDSKYFHSKEAREVIFDFDAEGHVVALTLREGDKDRRAERIEGSRAEPDE